MIDDDEVQRALDYLRGQASTAAQSKANYNYLKKFSDVLLSQLMVQSNEKTIAGQERDAFRRSEYLEHLKALQIAETEMHKHDFLLIAAREKIGAWRTYKSFNKTMGELA